MKSVRTKYIAAAATAVVLLVAHTGCAGGIAARGLASPALARGAARATGKVQIGAVVPAADSTVVRTAVMRVNTTLAARFLTNVGARVVARSIATGDEPGYSIRTDTSTLEFRDRSGSVLARTSRQQDGYQHHDASGRLIGYTVEKLRADGTREYSHYRVNSGGDRQEVGKDVITALQIEHYNALGEYTGGTMVDEVDRSVSLGSFPVDVEALATASLARRRIY